MQMKIGRRDFLASLAAAGACATGCVSSGVGKAPRLACQMWSVNAIWKKDPAAALAKMRAMGYEGVQSMAFWKWNRRDLAKLLGDQGMSLVDMPVDLAHVAPDRIESTIDFCREFGVDFVFVPHYGAKTRDDWKKLADGMVAAAHRLAPHGIKMGFHNHQHEFRTKFDGVSPMDMFIARPELHFELDVGHATLSGEDAVKVLNRVRGRVPSIHAKPGGGRSCGGAGDLNDWTGILAACREMGTRWIVVECETRLDTYDDIAASAQFLRPRI